MARIPEDSSGGQRISVILHHGGVTGPAKSLLPRLEWLADRTDFEIVAPAGGGLAELFRAFGMTSELAYAPMAIPQGLSAYARTGATLVREVGLFREHFRHRRTNLVLVISALLPSALLAARLERIPVLVYAAEVLDRRFIRSLPRTMAAWALVRVTGRLASVIVTCSRTVERQFSAVGAKTTTIYPGIGLEHAGGDRGRLRSEFGLADSDLCIAAVGNLNEGRAQDVLLRAMPSIREQAPGAHCLLAGAPLPYAGDRAYLKRLVRLVEQLGLEEGVHFLGFVADVANVYAAADVVVNPARVDEAFGRVALEALVAGRPVIATRVGAIPEILRDGIDALLVEPDDPSAIAGAVLRLWGDRDLANQLVGEGHGRVLAEFDERRGVEAFAEAVEAALGN